LRKKYPVDLTDLNVKYVAIQKQQRTERLILRRRADVLLGRQSRQERPDLWRADCRGMYPHGDGQAGARGRADRVLERLQVRQQRSDR
jgi:hypothetical protein